MNIGEFIHTYNLSYSAERVRFRPDGNLTNLPNHYKFTILREDNSYTGYFSCGAAWTAIPTLSGVLETISSDISSILECKDWAEFLVELGFTDSAQSIRDGYSAWTSCWQEHAGIQQLIGENGIQDLLNVDWDWDYTLPEVSEEMDQSDVE